MPSAGSEDLLCNIPTRCQAIGHTGIGLPYIDRDISACYTVQALEACLRAHV
ncbi:hypothetical protein ccbrp13_62510 [Ktedonobacteria bacterium brp13]|nr:hypothetical protein ccbrp13_62510 [Ktedonobacteria bacterium brp13]